MKTATKEFIINQSIEYIAIHNFYGELVAKRSGVPYINHIIEGLDVLESIGASSDAMRAYCLHPLFQDDRDIVDGINRQLWMFSSRALVLALEYRKTANAYLSKRVISDISEIELSPLKEVNDMLIADKVQNYKDFLIHHDGKHPRHRELNEYFINWFNRLGIMYAEVVQSITNGSKL